MSGDLKRGVDFIGVNVVFFCHDGKGNVLLGKRSQKCRDEHGAWDCGGGAIEFGESFEDALRRELKEEYGAEPLDIVFVASRSIVRTNEGRTTHWIANLHRVLIDPAQVTNNDPEKIDEISWFPFHALPEPLHTGFQEDVKLMRFFFEGEID